MELKPLDTLPPSAEIIKLSEALKAQPTGKFFSITVAEDEKASRVRATLKEAATLAGLTVRFVDRDGALYARTGIKRAPKSTSEAPASKTPLKAVAK